MTAMKISKALQKMSETYSKYADESEAKALTDKSQASWHSGRAGAFRQAAIDMKMFVDLTAEQEAQAPE